MPAATMMSGTIMGESNSAVISRRRGIASLLKPTAAMVPRTVAMTVAASPMKKLFWMASIQLPVVKMRSYQRSDQASGSRRNMPGVKLKNGSALNDRGTMTRIGRMRKNSTAQAQAATSQRAARCQGPQCMECSFMGVSFLRLSQADVSGADQPVVRPVERQDQDEKQSPQCRREPPVVRLLHVKRDQVGNHLAVGATYQRGGDVVAHRDNEHQERTG